MLANVTIGAILYTTYLQALGSLHEPSSRASGRTYPPPMVRETFAAGFVAGSVQSVFAAPLDALQVRFRTNEMLEGRYRSMWHYAYHKLGAIGLRGVFAGWSLSFLKDSWSYALFFSTFEFVKAQAYYTALPRLYQAERNAVQPIHPHYLIEPFFILSAGILASVAQQGVQHPITQLQNVHFNRLESLDYTTKLEKSHRSMMRLYYHAYLTTFHQANRQARLVGGWRRWLYKDFLWNTIKMTPSTSAGLIVFEIVRRRYAGGVGEGGAIRLDGIDFIL
jgi:Mitochondrial carrier protein